MPAYNPQVVEKRAAQNDKTKEVAYVRAEKAGDDTALAKLSEKYGDGNKKNSSDVRKRVWNCHECDFRNVDTRDVCGKCLAPNSSVISVEKQSMNDLVPARGTLDPSSRVHVVGGRAYRDFFQHGLDAKKMKHKLQQQQQQQQQQMQMQMQNNPSAGDDDDGNEDEPNCRFQPSNKNNNDDGDNQENDDEEDEEEEDEEESDGVEDQTSNEKSHANDKKHASSYGYYDYEQEEEQFARQDADQEDEDGIRYDSKRKCFLINKMNCPSRFWKFIIGSKRKTLQDIQRMTGATLVLPSSNNSANDKNNTMQQSAGARQKEEEQAIEISGPTKSAVAAARLKVEAIILDNQDRVEYTHFLSIPLAASNSQSKGAFAGYIQDMVRKCSDEERRIDPFMFQVPAKIHLTLLMLRLHNKEEIEKAKSLLVVVQAWMREMFATSKAISFKGVNYMNDDPTDVHVLYLDLVRDESYKKLVDLIQKINSLFIDSGLALPKDVSQNEKLHATIINSKWRGGDIVDGTLANYNNNSSSGSGGRISFDATEVLRLFGANGQALLGSHQLGRVDLSILGSGVGSDGYYSKVDSAFFP